MTSTATRAEVCVTACAQAWRGDGEILASPMGTVPTLGARLARATFAPDLVLTDGLALIVDGDIPLGTPAEDLTVEGWLPYRAVLDLLANGRRHVMMGPAQIDVYGNANISCVGDWARPKRQLLGARGAPGNTVNHATSYWVPRHSRRVLTAHVDVVCGVGNDRAAALPGPAARFHDLRRVITNLCVLDFETSDGRMRLVSVHPGVTVAEVVEATGFDLAAPKGSGQVLPGVDVPVTAGPTPEELRLIREVLDPRSLRDREVPG
ncbi:CoA-transferase subunit beta [Streptantibioticus rubrisoli]|uniref:CoA-transferase n=1 Tax=Streptantibioticus rubrisoli TaxID=1387313 RepID=A0ABT1PAG0_9ACTN|nr:CoA-transferase [Streptantibioticus rubrisoli]MCQ4042344.1 CoA-transferase [Streptantibioticus rubrisoli]